MISFPINLGHGRVYGKIHEDTIDFFWQGSLLVCTTTLTGTGTIEARLIRGSVSGQMNDGYCSCYGLTATVAFEMSKQ